MSERIKRAEAQRRRPWRPIYFAPIAAFAALAVMLGWGLTRNPSAIPSPLVGKLVPQFSLPPVKRRTLGLSSADLVGEPSIVNVFASWCVECRIEHPLIMQMQRERSRPSTASITRAILKTPRVGSIPLATPIRAPAPTSMAASQSTGVSTACPKTS
jgi:thiol:disulfide interchange protein